MINEKKDACYHKVKSRYSVWPSAYASGALVKCRKKGAKNWGNNRKDEALHTAYFNFAASLLEGITTGASPTQTGKRIGSALADLEDKLSPEEFERKKAQAARIGVRTAKRQKAYGLASGETEEQGRERYGASRKRFQKAGLEGYEERKKQQEKRKEAIKRRRELTTNPNDPKNDRRTDDERRKELRQRLKDKEASEQEARAAARGTTRRRINYSIGTDPKTGERRIISKREGEGGLARQVGSYFKRLARAKAEQGLDSPLQTIKGVARGVKGSTYGAFQAGRAAQKARRSRIDFSHTEYQRIGAILAEAKGVMPKKFSVKSGDKSAAGGLTAKGVKRYRAANPGSKLKTAVTTKPSKLKKGSKSAKRRKSFCARMGGMKKRLTSSKTANDPNSRINKALRKWNC